MNRRKLAAVTLAAVATVGLAGCRVEPGAAAFVSNVRITNERVDAVVASLSTGTQKLPGNQVASARQFVINQLVLGEVAKRIVAEKKLTISPMTPEDAAAQRQAATPTEIDRIYADTQPYLDAVQHSAAPADPTDADKQRLSTVLLGLGVPQAGIGQFLDAPQFKQSLGYRNVLQAGIAKYKAQISPRYAPAPYQLWTVQRVPLLTLDLTATGEPAVTDQPKTPQAPSQ